MKRLCIFALLIVLLAFPSNAHADVAADVAPPYYPPGSNPQPGTEVTQVRMLAETVVIEVRKDLDPESLGRAHISADFTMHNLGDAQEKMNARFPMAGNDGRGNYPEIGNLLIKINGKQIQYGRKSYRDEYYPNGDIPWADFDITFPAGKDTSIHVEYDLEGTGYYPYTVFYYILETGAGWQDTIGSADVILRLPYEASPQNVILNEEIGWGKTTPGGVFQGNELRWHFENFEPGEGQPVQNIEVALLAPSAWQAVLNARDNAAKHPRDGEAWGMLGKAYKQAFRMSKGYRGDPGGQELYQLSIEAYEKCLALKPEDAQWHAGFADLLAERAMWRNTEINTNPDTYRALEEIRTALKLAPNDPVVREIALNISGMLYGSMEEKGTGFDILWLTQTPTAWPTFPPATAPVDEATATAAPAGTEVVQAVPTRTNAPEATSTATPPKSSPLCGSAMLLPLLAIAFFIWKQR